MNPQPPAVESQAVPLAARRPAFAGLEDWAEVSPLLDELMDLDPAAGRVRLAELRQSSPALAERLQALQSLQDDAARAGFLTQPIAPALPASWVDPTGLQLGPYTLELPLGQGGTGSVWQARRNDGRFDGRVAVKLLHPSLLGRTGAQRFLREGQVLAGLDHPHIARLLDAGAAPDGRPYLVMEHVAGEAIDAHCRRHRLGIAARLVLFGQLVDAVAHAHVRGVVHRDIKPDNVLVDAQGRVKLLDFGIAKRFDAEAASAPALTRVGDRALTPSHAAPEQVRGEATGPACDVYALGVLLYGLLAGVHPTAPDGAGEAELLRSILDVAPRPLGAGFEPVPTDRTEQLERQARLAEERASQPATLRQCLRGDLQTICAQMLRKEPSARYADAGALAEDLRRYLAQRPVLARAPTLAYRARKLLQRHRRAGAFVAVCAVLQLGLAGVSLAVSLDAVKQVRLVRAESLMLQQQGSALAMNRDR